MTVGQRIAQKRRELGLSQEGLGERLGVSRQAIYKWESDAALPEIEKLVNLSREFSVSIDWLLGEEDNLPERPELTAEQLRMVEEIVGRYLDARPQPEPAPEGEAPEAEPAPPKKRRWKPVVLAGAAAVVLIVVFSNLFSRLDGLNQENQNLQMAVADIRSDVNNQIYGITRQVEEVLQSQNRLTAEQSAQITSADYRANRVTVSARALPRTYVEGMTAEFLLASGGETVTVPGELGEDHAFTASLAGPLSDDISVTVVFLTGERRETQLIEQFTDRYRGSFPGVNMEHSALWGSSGEVREYSWVGVGGNPESGAEIAGLRVGLFRDWKLLAWYEPVEGVPPNFHGFDEANTRFFRLNGEWAMEPDHVYCIAAVAKDNFGREWVSSSLPVKYDEESDFYDFYSPDGTVSLRGDPADWEY